MPEKHFTDQGGIELVGKNHGENEETRVTNRDDITRYNIDWLLDMSDAYTPDIFPNLDLPFFAEYMDNMTDNINAVNAAMEINKESPKVFIDSTHAVFDFGGPTRSPHDSAIRQHYMDSVERANGWWTPEDN